MSDGTFIDAKWSRYETPTSKQEQLNILVAVLGQPTNRQIERAIFPVNGPGIDEAMFRAANDELRKLRNIDYDLITVIDDLGSFGKTIP